MIEKLKQLNIGKIIENPSMKDYTTYKTGGNASVIVFPSSVSKLKELMDFIHSEKIKYKVIGNGSNLIFSDEFYDGIIIRLENFQNLDICDKNVTVGAGYSLMRLSFKMSKLGLTGLEFASGIPGTVGGAIFMNAGAYKSDMGYITTSVKALSKDGEIKEFQNKDLDFHYRTSFFKKNNEYIILEATLHLEYGNEKEIMELISTRKKRRMESQPLEYPSAGSVFRNPEGDFAGRLIEAVGLKGHKIGGAMVSLKHANFIVNTGGATSEDIRKLVLEIKKKVKDKFGIELIEEQEYVG